MMVSSEIQSVHNSSGNNNNNNINNNKGDVLQKTVSTVSSGDQDVVVPVRQFNDNDNIHHIVNGNDYYKKRGLQGRVGGAGDGNNGLFSSSSDLSVKNGSINGNDRTGDRSLSPNGSYYNDGVTQVNRLRTNSYNSDERSYHSSRDSKYNSNINYRNDSRALGTPKYSSSITAALDSLKEDITYEKQSSGENGEHRHFHLKTVSELVSLGTGFCGNNHKEQVFMEGKGGGFVPTTRSAALRNKERTIWLEQVPELELQTSLDFAILVHKVFAPLCNMSFGLLGGVALMQSFMSYTYLQNRDNVDEVFQFIESYNIFARVAPTAFYILLAICVVAVFDRFDLAHLDVRHCSDTLLYRKGWCLVLIYLITLFLTLCAAELDDMLLLYPYDKSDFANQKDMYSYLASWHTLNLSRCLFAMLGWFVVAVSEPEDLLLHHLKSIKQFDLQPNGVLLVGSPSSATNNDY